MRNRVRRKMLILADAVIAGQGESPLAHQSPYCALDTAKPNITLIVDAMAVGRPVIDSMHGDCVTPIPVTVHGWQSDNCDENAWYVRSATSLRRLMSCSEKISSR
jgi:hypothetical protein